MSDQVTPLRHRPRLLIVSYNLFSPDGSQYGGGFSKYEAHTADEMVSILHKMLDGRRCKITEVCVVA